MNEEIKQLARKAGFIFWGDEDWNPGENIDWASNYDEEIVKYTELVINSVFDSLRDISQERAVITNEELRTAVIKKYGLGYD